MQLKEYHILFNSRLLSTLQAQIRLLSGWQTEYEKFYKTISINSSTKVFNAMLSDVVWFLAIIKI